MRLPSLPVPSLVSLVALALLASAATVLAQDAAPPVRIATGLVAGAPTVHPGVRVFRGIPYAAPPTGERRWRAPQPAPAWTGVRQADEFGPACMQDTARRRAPWTEEFMVQEGVSEDCLYLNVWTASGTGAPAKRPVLVFIHGGAFREGSGAVSVYDGTTFAARGLVVVTINYRLGAFGFLAHPAFSADGPTSSSGVHGVLDAIAALTWVRDNIAAFGGDPARVTIGGQSAGAAMVHALTASPLAKGLFHRAIAQSGSGIAGITPIARAEAEKRGADLATALGATTAAALRAVPAADVMREAARAGAAGLTLRPAVDGRVLVADTPDAFARGIQNDVPMLTGLTADEGSSAPTYGRMTREQFLEQTRGRFVELADRFLALYPAATDAEAAVSQVAAARDRGKASMFLWAELRQKSPATTSKVFTYYFTRGMPWPEHPEFAAFHTGEVPYVFGALERLARPWTRVDRAVSDAMVSYWVNFATSGDPNGGQATPFPHVDPASPATMELGERMGRRPLMDDVRLAFWRDFFASPHGRRVGMF